MVLQFERVVESLGGRREEEEKGGGGGGEGGRRRRRRRRRRRKRRRRRRRRKGGEKGERGMCCEDTKTLERDSTAVKSNTRGSHITSSSSPSRSPLKLAPEG